MKKRTVISRREFCRRSARAAAVAAVAAPWIVSSSAARGSASRPPPSERVVLGHIGAGGQGSFLMGNFLAIPEVQSVAVCDAFTSRREGAARRVDAFYENRDGKTSAAGCAAYSDFRELLAREDIDAVIIATPDHWHVPIALAAVRAGKDVYVEKPLGVAVAWNRALRETVRRYGAVFQYGTQQRSDRNFRLACELARSAAIGKLERIEAWCAGMSAPGWYEDVAKGGGSTEPIPVPGDLDYEMWIGPAPMSPYTKDRCTQWGTYHVYDNSIGFIAGWGAHPLDIAQWGNDTDAAAPIVYEGTGTVPAEGLFNTISAWDMHCRYANGVSLRFMNTKTAAPVVSGSGRPFNDHGTTFFGPDGWVSVDRYGIYASDPALVAEDAPRPAVRLYESASQYQNFVDCVKTRAPTINPVESAYSSDLISHLCDIAIRTGRTIRWDPAKEAILDDESAARLLDRPLRSPWRL